MDTMNRCYPHLQNRRANGVTQMHSRPHHDPSTEFHAEAGPFTLVPLPRRRSSLVFVVDPGEVARLSPLSDTVDKPHVGGPRPRESCRRGVTLPL